MPTNVKAFGLAGVLCILTTLPALSDDFLKYCKDEHSYALSLAKRYLEFRINGGDLCIAADVAENLLKSRDRLRYDCEVFFETYPFFSLDTFHSGPNLRELDEYARQARDACDD